MYNTNLAYEEKHAEETKTVWFKNCKTAKLIASIPFAAGCNEPERTAIAHLCIYMAEIRGFQKFCAHLPSDDINLFKRLEFILTFEGGDTEIIDYGMNLLGLIMIEGYHKSEKEDQKHGVYNPFVSGAWNYEIMKNILKEKGVYEYYEMFNGSDGEWS